MGWGLVMLSQEAIFYSGCNLYSPGGGGVGGWGW